MSTLKRSERNCIIEDFRNGIINPNYEVIQTKTKGRYTVRKRKVPLTEEQIAALDNEDDYSMDDTTVTQVTKQRMQPRVQQFVEPMPKRSKKENALFDLQNQLNQQMLYRLNELTNKVVKLKTWKKKVKQDLYSEEPIVEPVDINRNEVEQNEVMRPIVEQSEEPSVEPVMQPNEYLNKIPQEYMNEQNVEQYEQYEQYEPMYNNRSRIDYSKFGF